MDDHPEDAASAAMLAAAEELRVLFGLLARRLREQTNHGDLTPSQKSVLIRLDRDGPAAVSDLARAEGVRPQSMGATVAALEAAGAVAGAPDPADGRRTILSLTPACRDWIAESRAARQDWLFRALRAEFAPDEQPALAAAIDVLRRLAGAHPSEGNRDAAHDA